MEESIPPLNGLLGTKLPVRDLAGTCSWYSRVFGWEAVMEFPGPDGTIAGAAGRLPGANPTGLSFRANPAAQSQEGLELAIDISHREDLEAWLEHLDREGVPHSPVIDASVAWLVVLKAETPAG